MGGFGFHSVLLLTSALLTVVLTADTTTTTTCLEASSNGCGNIVPATGVSQGYYLYSFSEKEKAGSCSREGVKYASIPQQLVASSILKPCKCKSTTCEACIKDKKKADTPTCCGKVLEFTYEGQTSYITDERNKKADCCFAHSVDAAGKPTHTCYCKAATSGCFNVCPTPPAAKSSATARIMNSLTVDTDTCAKNIAIIQGVSNQLCQAPLAYHPTGTDSTGKTLDKPVYLLTKSCADAIKAELDKKAKVEVTIGGANKFEYTTAGVTQQTLKNANVVAVTFNSYTGPCTKTPECTYNQAAMGDVDKNKCRFISYEKSKGKLGKTDVFMVKTCKDKDDKAAECFFVKDIAAYTQGTDLGAPLFCPLKSTGEYVLYGLFSTVAATGATSKLFPVLTI